MFDHLHRRAEKSDGLDKYPSNVLEVHENFTYRLMEFSAAKAEVVYGKPCQKRLLGRFRFTVFHSGTVSKEFSSIFCTKLVV